MTTPAIRKLNLCFALLGAALLVAGCEVCKQGRPPAKPNYFLAQTPPSAQSGEETRLTRARISTKSGEILVLEPDGSVSAMDLDSPDRQKAFAFTEDDLMALNANLTLDFAGNAGSFALGVPLGKSAQEKMIEEFASRTKPLLPDFGPDLEINPEDFIAVSVEMLNPGKGDDLVSVKANLREGVDADIAFSYATCALASWAKAEGANYGRHIRTLQATRNGKLLIDVAYTISDEKPLGLRVMETQRALQECKARGIPAA